MAEKSYPFSNDSVGGGGKLISQVDWQAMAHLWGGDRIDFQLVNPTYDSTALPFSVTISGSNLVISPGSAWVGGFYYTLDAPLTIACPVNNGANPRYDTVVIRASLATGSVNIKISTGLAAAAPTEPTPTRVLGDIWELPLVSIYLPALNGTRVINERRVFNAPKTAQVPWSRAGISDLLPPGTFTVDMDSNNSGGQQEGFHGRNGDMVTRTLGKRNSYTPDLFTVSNKPPSANRTCAYRYIAPGTVQFSMQFSNTSTSPVKASAGWFIGFTLPVAPSREFVQVFHGVLSNRELRNDMPNLIDITAQVRTEASNSVALYYPSPTNIGNGLDGLILIPGKSDLYISGCYETNAFDGGN